MLRLNNSNLFFGHDRVSDVKTNHTLDDGTKLNNLLSNVSLNIVLLIYNLSYWEQQKQTQLKMPVLPFLKIPRKDHVDNPEPLDGTKNRKRNVDAFRQHCLYLLKEYRDKLSPEQQQWLALTSTDHIPEFSTSFLVEQGRPLLNIHYRGGAGMYHEKSYKDKTHPDYQKHEKIYHAKIQYYKKRAEITERIVELKTKVTELGLKSRNKRQAPLLEREIKNGWDELIDLLIPVERSGHVLAKALLQHLKIIHDLENSITPGGVIAVGGMGVGRLEQQIMVKLFEPDESIIQAEFVTVERLLIESSSLTRLLDGPDPISTSRSAVHQDDLYLPAIAFRKVSHHFEYAYFAGKASDEHRLIPEHITATKTLFEEEAQFSNQSGLSCIHEVNPSTQKPILHSEYCVGKNLLELQRDYSLDLKARLILLYLTLQSYQRFVSKAEKPGYYIHGDIKPENIFVERSGHSLDIKFIDRAFTIESTNGHPVMLTTSQSKPLARGTSGYAAPEINQGCYSQNSDIYAFGHMIIDFLHPKYIPESKLLPNELAVYKDIRPYAAYNMKDDNAHFRPVLSVILRKLEQSLVRCGINPANLHEDLRYFEGHLPDKSREGYRKRR